MVEVVFAVPVLPGKEELWRQFNQELLDVYGDNHARLMERLGVRSYEVFLARLPGGDVAVARVEAEEPAEILNRLEAAGDPFARWFKEELRKFHGGGDGQMLVHPNCEWISTYPEEGQE